MKTHSEVRALCEDRVLRESARKVIAAYGRREDLSHVMHAMDEALGAAIYAHQCPHCLGGSIDCTRCEGTGHDDDPFSRQLQPCPWCEGTGREMCPDCRGSGQSTDRE